MVEGLDANGITVAWSQDGQQLFAEGYHLGHGDLVARRWDKGGAGSFIDIVGARNTVTQFVRLRDNRMLFTDGVGFGLIDATANASRLQVQGSIDVAGGASAIGARETLKISADARTVQ